MLRKVESEKPVLVLGSFGRGLKHFPSNFYFCNYIRHTHPPTWITLLDPFALHAPFHHLWLADFGLVEKDMLCAIMMITAGVDLGSL